MHFNSDPTSSIANSPVLLEMNNAAKDVICKVAELIRYDRSCQENFALKPYDPYYSQSLKFNELTSALVNDSILPAFIFNFYYKLEHIKKHSDLKAHPFILKGLLDIYLESQAYNSNTNLETELAPQFLAIWTLTEFLPKKIEQLGLNEGEVRFLGRIGNYLLSQFLGGYNEERIDELLARYLELKAAGVKQGPLNSFDSLLNLHNKYASPIVREQLNEYYKECEELGMPSEDYQDQYHDEL